MSSGGGEGAGVGFATMRGRDFPTIRQFTVLLENRVGQLLAVLRRFEGSRVRIVGLSINDTTECALVRFPTLGGVNRKFDDLIDYDVALAEHLR